jgi:hypothetical protein
LFGFDFGEPFILGLYVNQTNINFICLFTKLQEGYFFEKISKFMAVTFSMLHFKYKLFGLLAHVTESHISY